MLAPVVIPTLSEFSYGFALTNKLIGVAGEPLRIAPVFPNLVEEGRAGGGYDVHLDLPGFRLFLQFKRSDCMVRSNTRERAKGLPHHGTVAVSAARYAMRTGQ